MAGGVRTLLAFWIGGAYVGEIPNPWNTINDSQTPNWTAVNTTVTVVWTEINTGT